MYQRNEKEHGLHPVKCLEMSAIIGVFGGAGNDGIDTNPLAGQLSHAVTAPLHRLWLRSSG